VPDDLLSVRHRTGKSADKFLFHCSCHTFASDSEPRYHAFVSKLIASDEGRGGGSRRLIEHSKW
jgi:hypothetical protein